MSERIATARVRRQYDAYAPRYDVETGVYERIMLGNGRRWACAQARGTVLEVAVGTGRNLGFYPPGLCLYGLDLSAGMLTLARRRARRLAVPVALVEGDAQALPFSEAAFDTVVCTLGLSSIPDDRAALAHMHRVLRPGGKLVLLGHVASPHRGMRVVQRLIERIGRIRVDDQQTRHVVPLVRAVGFTVCYRSSSRAGAIERCVAVKRSAGV